MVVVNLQLKKLLGCVLRYAVNEDGKVQYSNCLSGAAKALARQGSIARYKAK